MDLGFSGGKACGGFPSCLLTGAGREPGQECEAPPTGGLLLMRFLSCAIHRLGDGKAFYQNAQPAPKWSCLWGLGGSALNKQPGIFAPAKIPGLASVGPTRHCLPVSRTPYFALSGGISSNEKRGRLHILLLIIRIFQFDGSVNDTFHNGQILLRAKL